MIYMGCHPYWLWKSVNTV